MTPKGLAKTLEYLRSSTKEKNNQKFIDGIDTIKIALVILLIAGAYSTTWV